MEVRRPRASPGLPSPGGHTACETPRLTPDGRVAAGASGPYPHPHPGGARASGQASPRSRTISLTMNLSMPRLCSG